jgi:hypothetical protein
MKSKGKALAFRTGLTPLVEQQQLFIFLLGPVPERLWRRPNIGTLPHKKLANPAGVRTRDFLLSISARQHLKRQPVAHNSAHTTTAKPNSHVEEKESRTRK